jgi:hypothetical protein
VAQEIEVPARFGGARLPGFILLPGRNRRGFAVSFCSSRNTMNRIFLALLLFLSPAIAQKALREPTEVIATDGKLELADSEAVYIFASNGVFASESHNPVSGTSMHGEWKAEPVESGTKFVVTAKVTVTNSGMPETDHRYEFIVPRGEVTGAFKRFQARFTLRELQP